MIFIDTSALLAVLDEADREHSGAIGTLRRLQEGGEQLVTHNYVVVEAISLAQRRLGLAAVRDLVHEVLPQLEILWIDEAAHQAAVSALLASPSRSVSLVDRVSFHVMRERGLQRAFVFDADFEAEGFEALT